MSSREEMLGTIRNILKTQEKVGLRADKRILPPPLGDVMPRIPSKDLPERFESELQNLGCSTHRVATSAELEGTLCSILEQTKAKSVVLSRNPLLDQLRVGKMLGNRGLQLAVWPAITEVSAEGSSFRDRCFGAGAGITGVDFALAETGSLVLTSATEGSQLVSLAPPSTLRCTAGISCAPHLTKSCKISRFHVILESPAPHGR